jgi:hypothetical protein
MIAFGLVTASARLGREQNEESVKMTRGGDTGENKKVACLGGFLKSHKNNLQKTRLHESLVRDSKKPSKTMFSRACCLVAGIGFEPMTFRL